jgi:peptidoglycan/LPS O-acetylase OafA/YrhL
MPEDAASPPPIGDSTAPTPPRLQNFDFVRLFAASSVIFSHAFLIAEETEEHEPFVRILGEHNIIGYYGVLVFFLISGYLVTQSAVETGSTGKFLWKRFLRIYPALIAYAVLAGCVLGTIFTTMGAAEYWARLLGPKYVVWTAILPDLRKSIPTVEFYRGAWGMVINGSLWTIPQEMFCYLTLALIVRLRPRLWIISAIALASFLALLARLGTWNVWVENFVDVAPAFFAGSIYYQLGPRLRRVCLAVSLLVLLLATLASHLLDAFPVFGAAPILSLASSHRLRLPDLKPIGDVSYGTYLYGWPVEQVARAMLGDHRTWWAVFGISLPAAIMLGWLSWHLLEKRCLRLKGISFAWTFPKPA